MSSELMKMSALEQTVISAIRMIGSEWQERLRAEALCRRLLEDDRVLTEAFKQAILPELKSKGMFSLIEPMAERLLSEGSAEQPVLKAYGQALTEGGKIAAAQCVLRHAMTIEAEKNGNSSEEYLDLCGMMGRTHKKRFVTLVFKNAPAEQQNSELQKALDWYSKGDTDYHLINRIALASRAAADGRPVAAGNLNIEDAAHGIQERIRTKVQRDSWDYANAVEASLPFRSSLHELLQRTYEFIGRMDASVFEIASLLRQCEEIWQIGKESNGQEVIAILKAALFERQGGAIDLTRSTALSRIETALTGDKGRRSVEWFHLGLERSKAVGLITTKDALGTGFLVKGSDIFDAWGDDPVFMTNSHVTLGDDVSEMTVRFHASDGSTDYKVREHLRSSPPDSLDFSVYRLEGIPAGACCAPIAARRPLAPISGMNERVYVIGHPDAGELCISLYNNVLVRVGDMKLHYTAATEPGSSGSPVFNENWEIIGVHHGVNVGYFDDGAKYSAQEGIVFEAIMDQAKLDDKPKAKKYSAQGGTVFQAIMDQAKLDD